MTDHTEHIIITSVAIICIASMEIVALIKGTDGVAFASAVAAIAALAGYGIAKLTS